jgi:hypothetical protein
VAIQLNNGVTDEYVRLNNTATPISSASTDSWSMGLWFMRDTDKATNEYIALMTTDIVGTATSGNGVRISSADALQSTTNGSGTAIQSSQPLGVWTYVAVTFGSSGTAYYGTSTTLSAGSGRVNVSGVLDTLVVGRSVVTSPVNSFSGRIAHLRLWTGVALSQAEFEAEMVSQSAVKTSGLWLAWEFGSTNFDINAEGTTARDPTFVNASQAGNYVAGPLTSTQSNAPRARILQMLRNA